MKRLFIIALIVLSTPLFAAVNPESPFQVVWDSTPIKLEVGKKFKTSITIRVPPGHYLYADKTDLDFESLEGIRINEVKFPKPVDRQDPYFGKTMKVFETDVTIEISGHVPEDLTGGEREVVALLSFQGCTPNLCLRPEEQEIVFKVEVEPIQIAGQPKHHEVAKEEVPSTAEPTGIRSLLKSANFNAVMEKGFLISLLFVFIAGILVSFTPCIWPIIPIVLFIIGVEAQKRWPKNVALAATFVAGLALINAGLGITAVALGRGIGFLFQYRIFLVVVVLFFIAMSLSMFGLFEFHPLRFLHDRLHKLGGKGFRGSFLMGLATGLIASPCASPVLAAILGHVGLKQSYFWGFWLLVVFGIGMGVVFIVFGSLYGALAGRFKGGHWTIWVRRALGVMLLIPAIFYLKSLVRWDGVLHPSPDKPRVEWIMSQDQGFKFARQSSRPIMIEFYADWCPPCRALETVLFKRDDIIKLSYQLVPIKIDATVATDAVKEAISRYHVVGWPSFYFLSPEGKIYDDLTVISYNPEKVEEGMRAAIERAGGKP